MGVATPNKVKIWLYKIQGMYLADFITSTYRRCVTLANSIHIDGYTLHLLALCHPYHIDGYARHLITLCHP